MLVGTDRISGRLNLLPWQVRMGFMTMLLMLLAPTGMSESVGDSVPPKYWPSDLPYCRDSLIEMAPAIIGRTYIDPTNPEAWFERGLALFCLDSLAAAIRSLDHAILLLPDLAPALYVLSIAMYCMDSALAATVPRPLNDGQYVLSDNRLCSDSLELAWSYADRAQIYGADVSALEETSQLVIARLESDQITDVVAEALVPIWFGEGVTYSECRASIDSALKENHKDPVGWWKLALIESLEKNVPVESGVSDAIDSAVYYFKYAKPAQKHFLIGLGLACANDASSATIHIDSALAIDPDYLEAKTLKQVLKRAG